MVDTIYIEEEVRFHSRTVQILKRYRDAEQIICERYSEVFNPKSQDFKLQKKNPSLILARKSEGYVLPTPSTYGVGGDENYYFSHMLNCIYDCRYCFLQGMYSSAHYVVFVNYEDYTQAIAKKALENPDKEIWFFSGYDCDSLAFEPVTGFMQHCFDAFKSIPNAWLEIRTKSTQVRSLLNRSVLPKAVVAFSFTPDDFSKAHERGVPGVDKRIKAMCALQNKGWRIGLRFDPMMSYKNYQSSYQQLFEDIFTLLNPHLIHSVSMGGFRMPKGFFKQIKKQYPVNPLYNLSMDETNGIKSYSPDNEKRMVDFCRAQLLRWVPENKLYHCDI